VREGASVPDVATPETFKQALVAAKSVAYTDPAEGGTSGIYFAGLTERMGIGDAVKQKALLTKGGREAAIEVAEGRAEMAVIFVSEAIAVKGVKVAGLLPPSLQDYSTYAAAIPQSSTDAAAAINPHRPAQMPVWKSGAWAGGPAAGPTSLTNPVSARIVESVA